MKYCKSISNIFLVMLISALVFGCGTITFFPAAPAQKAADNVIDDIWPAAQPTLPIATVRGGGKDVAPQPAIAPASPNLPK